MKTITLMRHGDAPFNDDMERPLSELGRCEAANIGGQLQAYWDECAGLGVPDYVLCSWTPRTKDTFAQVKQNGLDLKDVEARSLKQLEHASPRQVLDMIVQLDDQISSVMIIGHDTYLCSVMRALSTKDSIKKFASLSRSFSHAQCVVMTHETLLNWSKIKPQSFEIKAGFRPKL